MEGQQHSHETSEDPTMLEQDRVESEISHERVHVNSISDVEQTFRHRIVSVLHFPFDRIAQWLADRGVHPIRLTASKIPLSVAAIGLHQLDPIAGVLAFVAASAADILDGKLARCSGKTTVEGALLDAFVDKFVNAYMYLYVYAQLAPGLVPIEQAMIILMSMNVFLDVVSQSLRSNPFKQAVTCVKVVWDPESATIVEGKTKDMANRAGKQKAWAQFLGITFALMSSSNPITQSLATVSFSVASVLGGRSIAGRLGTK